MNESGQRGKERYVLHVLFLIQDGLIQMGNAPPLGNVKAKQGRKLLYCLSRHGVSPGTEGNKKLAVLVESHVSVHHAGKADGAKPCDGNAILLLYVLNKRGVAILQPLLNVIHAIRPDLILKTIFPVTHSHGNGLMRFIHQNSLDPGRTKLNSKYRSSGNNCVLCSFHIHPSLFCLLGYYSAGKPTHLKLPFLLAFLPLYLSFKYKRGGFWCQYFKAISPQNCKTIYYHVLHAFCITYLEAL